jgi:hypothetical protein
MPQRQLEFASAHELVESIARDLEAASGERPANTGGA